MNKLHLWPAVAATSATAAVLYVLCAILIAVSPLKTVALLGSMFHGIDLTKIMETTITFPSFLEGLVVITLFTALTTLLVVFLYNACVAHCCRKGWIKDNENKTMLRRK